MAIKLYPHNQRTFERVCEMLSIQDRAAVIHPTGTGKSYIAFALAEKYPERSFLWLAPSEYIFRSQAQSLYQSEGVRLDNITCKTYAWVTRNKQSLGELHADFIILDEFHRAGAVEWQKAVQQVLSDNPDAKILGLSATSVRYLDGRRDMAEELFSGAIASEMGLCEAMARGILPVPQYVVTTYNYEKRLREYEERNERLSSAYQREQNRVLIEELRSRLQNAVGVSDIMQRHLPDNTGKYLVFCSDSEQMQMLIAKVPEWFGKVDRRPHVYSISIYNPDAEDNFRAFLEDDSLHLKLLFSIDMLNEGIHVPGVDGVILLRPTASPIIYKQQIGRALSSGSGKHPVIIDMVNNCDSLRSVEDFREEFDQLRELYVHEEGLGTADDLPFRVIDELADCRELFIKLQKNLDSSWDYYYEDLRKYKEQHGNIRVPHSFVSDTGLKLGQWYFTQKGLYSRGCLDETKIKRLEELGIEWKVNQWLEFESWCELLKDYIRENGNADVPEKFQTADGYWLGRWCRSMRLMKQNSKLSREREQILDEIGFDWQGYNDSRWENGFAHAEDYFKQKGDLCVPRSYTCQDGFSLGSWIQCQRIAYKSSYTGCLDEERIQRLEVIGMVWKMRDPNRTPQFYAAFRQYVAQYHSPFVPSKYVTEDGLKLGMWVTETRQSYRKGNLSEKMKNELERIGFAFETVDPWQKYYEQAKAYYDEHGTLVLSKEYREENGNNLLDWIRKQYRRYISPDHGYLTEEQVTMLEEINITCYTSNQKKWLTGLAHAKKYREQYGVLRVPNKYICEDGFQLGKWLQGMKQKRSRGQVPAEQIAALDEIGMVWNLRIQ